MFAQFHRMLFKIICNLQNYFTLLRRNVNIIDKNFPCSFLLSPSRSRFCRIGPYFSTSSFPHFLISLCKICFVSHTNGKSSGFFAASLWFMNNILRFVNHIFKFSTFTISSISGFNYPDFQQFQRGFQHITCQTRLICRILLYKLDNFASIAEFSILSTKLSTKPIDFMQKGMILDGKRNQQTNYRNQRHPKPLLWTRSLIFKGQPCRFLQKNAGKSGTAFPLQHPCPSAPLPQQALVFCAQTAALRNCRRRTGPLFFPLSTDLRKNFCEFSLFQWNFWQNML